ncbi:MAG TPA: hypothetical protein VF666_08520 [Pyrinomonadaceae bacterium]|jgi:hypothetical protein
MYTYTLQAMPGSKAKFEGDTSVKYQVRRRHTTASPKDKGRTAVIRTDMEYAEAVALIKIFTDKEMESRDIKKMADSHLTQNA